MAAEYEASELSRQDFCEQHGVPLKTLARYVARYRREHTGNSGVQRWVAVEVAAKRPDGAELCLVLDGGRRIEVKRGFDVETLRRVVVALEQA
ncbi:MAG: hypothetical protein WCF30_07575 [Terracidiphilus sp.]